MDIMLHLQKSSEICIVKRSFIVRFLQKHFKLTPGQSNMLTVSYGLKCYTFLNVFIKVLKNG